MQYNSCRCAFCYCTYIIVSQPVSQRHLLFPIFTLSRRVQISDKSSQLKELTTNSEKGKGNGYFYLYFNALNVKRVVLLVFGFNFEIHIVDNVNFMYVLTSSLCYSPRIYLNMFCYCLIWFYYLACNPRGRSLVSVSQDSRGIRLIFCLS